MPATVRMLFLLAPFVPSRALRGRRCSQLHYADEETEAQKRDLATGRTAGQGRIRDLEPDRGESPGETSAGRPGVAVEAGGTEPGRADPVPPGLPAAEDAFIRVCVRGFQGGPLSVRAPGSPPRCPLNGQRPRAQGTPTAAGRRRPLRPGQDSPPRACSRPGARQETPSALFRGNRWRFFPGLPEARQMVPGLRPRSPGEGGPLFALRQAFRPNPSLPQISPEA